jgi:hypothetical protein
LTSILHCRCSARRDRHELRRDFVEAFLDEVRFERWGAKPSSSRREPSVATLPPELDAIVLPGLALDPSHGHVHFKPNCV